MKILLIGADGQVGWELRRSLLPLGEVTPVTRGELDLAQVDRISPFIRAARPDVIVNAAAYTAVEKAEQEEGLATAVNGTAVGILAEEARRAGALFIHFSTDYVFDGSKQTSYTESDSPNPINAYGRSKLAGETFMRQIGGTYIILRTSWIYSARGSNFLRTILRKAAKQEPMRVVCDQIGAPTWARDIANATAQILRVTLETNNQTLSEIFHLTASGQTSWYEYARAIVDVASECGLLLPQAQRIHPIESKDYASSAARPKNSLLAGQRLFERFGIRLPDWKTSLKLCLQDMNA